MLLQWDITVKATQKENQQETQEEKDSARSQKETDKFPAGSDKSWNKFGALEKWWVKCIKLLIHSILPNVYLTPLYVNHWGTKYFSVLKVLIDWGRKRQTSKEILWKEGMKRIRCWGHSEDSDLSC
jgi:hypothetical protein